MLSPKTDCNGNRTSLTDITGKHTLYEYDVLGQLISEQEPYGHTVYGYDIADNMPKKGLAYTDFGGAKPEESHREYHYTYDAEGLRCQWEKF